MAEQAVIDPTPLARLAEMCKQRAECPQRMSALDGVQGEGLRAASIVLGIMASEIERAMDEGRELAWGKGQIVRLPPAGVALRVIERQAVLAALRATNGSQLLAARLLHISPRVMNYKMLHLGLERPRDRQRGMVA